MTDFAVPEWSAPFDTREYLEAVPEGALIKGYFAATIVAAARARNVTLANQATTYRPFLDYPLLGHNRLFLEAAAAFFPGVPTRQAIRKMGRAAIQSLTETTFGRALLGGFLSPGTIAQALAAVARSYPRTLTNPNATAEVAPMGEQSAIFRVRDAWIFLEAQQVGILEGVYRACGVKGEVRVAMTGPASGEFECTWEAAGGGGGG
jgi:uncharacterized protein (TIGR02265 family)